MSQPIRVLNIFMLLDRGGAETFAMNVYRNIDREKVQFDFLVHGDKKGAYEEEIRSLGGKIFRLPEMTDFFKYKSAVRAFFENHPEYKIIHSHASELGLFVFKEAKKRNVPYRICHAHSFPQGVSIKTPLRFLFKKAMLRYSNALFACSKSAGEWQFGKNKSFTVIKNGISVNKFSFDEKVRNIIRNELGIENKLVIGHVGRFEKPKNHEFLIDVFKQISDKTDSILLLIGDGSLKHRIEEKVHDNQLSDKVLFLGSQNDVSKYLNAMDYFVFPSLFEGLGIVLIEAQANGLNCIVSDRIPVEAFVSDLVKRISLSDHPTIWANTVLESVSHKYDRVDFASQIESAGYDINEIATNLQKFYLQCI